MPRAKTRGRRKAPDEGARIALARTLSRKRERGPHSTNTGTIDADQQRRHRPIEPPRDARVGQRAAHRRAESHPHAAARDGDDKIGQRDDGDIARVVVDDRIGGQRAQRDHPALGIDPLERRRAQEAERRCARLPLADRPGGRDLPGEPQHVGGAEITHRRQQRGNAREDRHKAEADQRHHDARSRRRRPVRCGSVRRRPKFTPDVISIRLFGPGVTPVMKQKAGHREEDVSAHRVEIRASARRTPGTARGIAAKAYRRTRRTAGLSARSRGRRTALGPARPGCTAPVGRFCGA